MSLEVVHLAEEVISGPAGELSGLHLVRIGRKVRCGESEVIDDVLEDFLLRVSCERELERILDGLHPRNVTIKVNK